MRWPDKSDKWWFCAHVRRGKQAIVPFCLQLSDTEPREFCAEHNQPWVGWVQADNRRKARRAALAVSQKGE